MTEYQVQVHNVQTEDEAKAKFMSKMPDCEIVRIWKDEHLKDVFNVYFKSRRNLS